MKKNKKGFVKVVLARSKKGSVGRLFAAGNESFCFMPRKIRHTVMNDEYLDVDIHNCHAAILADVLSLHFPEKDWSHLEKVRDHREELCQQYSVEKQYWCSVLNGALVRLEQDDFIRGFKHCVERARKLIIRNNPDLYQHVKGKLSEEDMWNLDGKFISAFLGEIETRLISDLIEVCFDKGLLEYGGKSAVCSYEFDGFKLLKQNVEKFGGVDRLMALLNKTIRDRWGFMHVKLVCKPMEGAYDIAQYLDDATEGPARKKIKEAEDLDEETYQQTKQSFEDVTSDLYNFKLRNPLAFVRVKQNVIQPLTKRQFLDMYEDYPVKGFIQRWIEDPDKLFYEKMDMLPPPLICPTDVFNLYEGLAIEKATMNINLDCLTAEESERGTRGMNLILNHMRNQVGGEEEAFNYLLDWLALKIQQPGRRAEVALVFISNQGSGKNTLWDYVGETLLGEKILLSHLRIDSSFLPFLRRPQKQTPHCF